MAISKPVHQNELTMRPLGGIGRANPAPPDDAAAAAVTLRRAGGA